MQGRSNKTVFIVYVIDRLERQFKTLVLRRKPEGGRFRRDGLWACVCVYTLYGGNKSGPGVEWYKLL